MKTNTTKIGLMLAMLAFVAPLALPTGALAAGSNVVIVTVTDNKYDQPALQIASGTTVKWINMGSMYHTVTVTAATTGDAFNVGLEPGGGAASTFSYTFVKTGSIVYHCVPHYMPQNGAMDAVIIVV